MGGIPTMGGRSNRTASPLSRGDHGGHRVPLPCLSRASAPGRPGPREAGYSEPSPGVCTLIGSSGLEAGLAQATEELARAGMDRVCTRLTSTFRSRASHPGEFIRQTRVLPMSTASGIRMDFIFAAFPFEKAMIDRAVERPLGGVTARVATRKDLILLKIGNICSRSPTCWLPHSTNLKSDLPARASRQLKIENYNDLPR